MKLCYLPQMFLPAIAVAYIWPDPALDEIESLLFEAGSFVAGGVSTCNQTAFIADPNSGRTNAQEWVRTAYHDMATADVQAGTGGMDASIAFETLLNRSENVGSGIPDSIRFFQLGQTPRVSLADIIAIGALQAVQSCSAGRIILPFRAGRINAESAGPPGVPEPHQDLESHKKSFARQNFTVSEMIAVVACGHTLGGVHGVDFPEIVPKHNDSSNTDNIQTFDSTGAVYDNNIAKEFVANSTQNALAFGPNVTTRSDFRIFTADEGKMIKQMAASSDFFYSTCSTVLEKMINTVPKNVVLTEPFRPLPVKPVAKTFDISLLSDGTMRVSGEIRVLEDGPPSTTRKVTIRFKPRNPASCNGAAETCGASQSNLPAVDSHEIASPLPGNPNFTHYTYNISLPVSQGLSSFVIDMEDGGSSKTENNGGGGFPVTDLILVQTGFERQIESCHTDIKTGENGSINKTIRIQVAILDEAKLADVTLVGQVPRRDWTIPTYTWREIKAAMTKSGNLNGTGYSVYSGTLSLPWNGGPDVDNPASSFYVGGVKDGKEVRTEFKFWQEIPRCST